MENAPKILNGLQDFNIVKSYVQYTDYEFKMFIMKWMRLNVVKINV
jgi:hypothetical protein